MTSGRRLCRLEEIPEGEAKAYRVEGFEYEGRKYKTLSAIANQIAGSRWNGFLFFGLKKRGAAASEESAT